MALIQTPVKGMQDFLPADMALRQHVLGLIRDTYGRYGFSQIGTPYMEHIGNLTGKNGGENEKLIFKVEKRGRELEKSLQKVRQSEDLRADEAGTELAGTCSAQTDRRRADSVSLPSVISTSSGMLP